MKAFLRHIYKNLLSLYFVDIIFPGFSLPHTTNSLLSAAFVWLILNKIVKPIIKLLLLPINLITLGLFSWAISVITLLLLQYFVESININAFYFPGVSYQGFTIPAFNINLLFSYLITAILLNLVSNTISWLHRS